MDETREYGTGGPSSRLGPGSSQGVHGISLLGGWAAWRAGELCVVLKRSTWNISADRVVDSGSDISGSDILYVRLNHRSYRPPHQREPRQVGLLVKSDRAQRDRIRRTEHE